VGVLARPDATDAIARVLVRATGRDHPVLVATGGADPETVALVADADGAVPVDAPPDPDRARQVLAVTAQERGLPGLLFHDDPETLVDHEASVAVWESSPGYTVPTVASVSGEPPAPEVLVAIPAYNEAGTVGRVVADAHRHADAVLVVDDGSEDETVERALDAGATVVEHGANRGYGAALKTAFREADRRDASRLVVLDGDGQHDPADVEVLAGALSERDADVVIGTRFGGGGDSDVPLYRRVGIAVINTVTNLSLGHVADRVRVSDAQSGFRAYSRRAIESLAGAPRVGDGMGASTDILFHADRRGYDVAEVDVEISYDVGNPSSQHPVEHGLHLVNNLLATVERDHPILLFGVPGGVSVAGGTALGYWTVSNYLGTGTFPLGVALTAAVFLFLGTLAVFTAVILHAVEQR
jgi:hypothetical protein